MPILALVKDSPEVFLFVQAIAIFCQNFTVLVLIFGPKMYKVFVGQADPTGMNVAGRATNPRFSLSNRQGAATGERRTSLLSAGGGERFPRRTESVEGDGSTYLSRPLAVTFEDDSTSPRPDSDALESAGKALADDMASEQFCRLSGEKNSSFRHSTEVWMGNSAPTDISEVSRTSNHGLSTSSIKEESQQQEHDSIVEGETKDVAPTDATSDDNAPPETLNNHTLE